MIIAMLRMLWLCTIISLSMIGLASPTRAQTTSTKLRVELFLLPPFAMERDGTLVGFSIDLWREIAARIKVETDYHMAPGSTTILPPVMKLARRDSTRSKSPEISERIPMTPMGGFSTGTFQTNCISSRHSRLAMLAESGMAGLPYAAQPSGHHTDCVRGNYDATPSSLSLPHELLRFSRRVGIRSFTQQMGPSCDPDLAGNLAIALPVSFLINDNWIVHCRLGRASCVSGP